MKEIRMLYILIALLYVGTILGMAIMNSQHIGYDVPRKTFETLPHGTEKFIEFRKTRSMWDE